MIDLRKPCDETVALENSHLDVPTGDLFGFLGAKGAWKTSNDDS